MKGDLYIMKKFQKYICIFMCAVSLFLINGIYAEAYSTSTVEIAVECAVMKYFKDYEYKIAIEPQEDNAPMPKEDILSIANGTEGKFKIDITEPDTFTYRIYEQKPKNKNINYDYREYLVTLFVTDNKGKLSYSLSVNENESDTKTNKVSFKDSERFVLGSSVDEESPEPESEPESESSVEESSFVSQTSETVLTGDGSNIHVMAAVMAVSFITAVIAVISVKHREREM